MALTKEWKDMTKEEREEVTANNKAAAMESVKSGKFPQAVPFSLGKGGAFSMFLKPKGVSEKGSVSYSVPPQIITIGGRRVRLNSISVSVLAENSTEHEESLDMTNLL